MNLQISFFNILNFCQIDLNLTQNFYFSSFIPSSYQQSVKFFRLELMLLIFLFILLFSKLKPFLNFIQLCSDVLSPFEPIFLLNIKHLKIKNVFHLWLCLTIPFHQLTVSYEVELCSQQRFSNQKYMLGPSNLFDLEQLQLAGASAKSLANHYYLPMQLFFYVYVLVVQEDLTIILRFE